jgi:hypothetical protein
MIFYLFFSWSGTRNSASVMASMLVRYCVTNVKSLSSLRRMRKHALRTFTAPSTPRNMFVMDGVHKYGLHGKKVPQILVK